MPGLYTEPTSRSAPTHDPACDEYRTNGDKPGRGRHGALVRVPVQLPERPEPRRGDRAARSGSEEPPDPAAREPPRHPGPGPVHPLQPPARGLGRQRRRRDRRGRRRVEGRRRPERRRDEEGRRDPRRPRRRLRPARTSRCATPRSTASTCSSRTATCSTHFKAYYNGLYGTLTFVEDHGVQQHCDAVGHGDSGIYPGAAVETGAQRPAGHRRSVTTRRSGSATSTTTWRGTPGPTATPSTSTTTGSTTTRSGLQTDVVTGAGHPGYPGDSMLVENNLLLLEQLQRLRGGLERQAGVPVPGRHRPVDRRRQPPPGPRQLLLRQLAPRDDALQRARPAGLRPGRRTATSRRAATPTARRRRSTTATTTTTWACGPTARPTRTAPTSGGTRIPGTVGNCWWGNTPAEGAQITTSPGPAARTATTARTRTRASGTGNPAQTGELAQLRGGVRDAQLRPQRARARGSRRRPSRSPAAALRRARSGSAFSSPPAATAAARPRRAARPAQRLQRRLVRGLERGRRRGPRVARREDHGVRRRRRRGRREGRRATATSLTTEQANDLFNTDVPAAAYAQGFLLYKLYTYAAVLTE